MTKRARPIKPKTVRSVIRTLYDLGSVLETAAERAIVRLLKGRKKP